MLIDQAQVGFVDERRRLERVVSTLSSQMCGRAAAKLVVDEWDELIARAPIAGAPRVEQES